MVISPSSPYTSHTQHDLHLDSFSPNLPQLETSDSVPHLRNRSWVSVTESPVLLLPVILLMFTDLGLAMYNTDAERTPFFCIMSILGRHLSITIIQQTQ